MISRFIDFGKIFFYTITEVSWAQNKCMYRVLGYKNTSNMHLLDLGFG